MTQEQKQTATDIAQGLKHSAEVRGKFIQLALDTFPDANKATIGDVLAKTQQLIRDEASKLVGDRLANMLANWMSLEHIKEYKTKLKQEHTMRRQAVMDASLKEVKWRLGPALKEAQKHDRTIKMEDIQKWRRENYNLEKRPRKFNSWVANRAKEEYQADLFFFDDLKQRDEEPAKYNAGLLVVDTFSKKIAVVPIEGKTAGDLDKALKQAFEKMRGKPEMLYSDAEPGLTSNMTQKWLREQNIAHNVTLRHAPVAERMIGHIKNQIIKEIRGNNKKWWEVVDKVVKDYNENHVSRSTKMTPKEAAKKENEAEVKEQLESIRKTDNPQARIAEGDKVRVIIKKKFEKGYMPDWSDEVYTVQSVSKGKDDEDIDHISQGPIIERQALYQLRDPNNTLSSYKKGMFMRSELLLVKKAR